MKTQEAFSQRLRKLRKEQKVSQRELAKALNLSDVSVSRYELGTAQPSLETFHSICDYFHVTPDYLLGITNTPTEIVKRNSQLIDVDYQNINELTQASTLLIDALSGKAQTGESNFSIIIRLIQTLDIHELLAICNFSAFMYDSKKKQQKEISE